MAWNEGRRGGSTATTRETRDPGASPGVAVSHTTPGDPASHRWKGVTRAFLLVGGGVSSRAMRSTQARLAAGGGGAVVACDPGVLREADEFKTRTGTSQSLAREVGHVCAQRPSRGRRNHRQRREPRSARRGDIGLRRGRGPGGRRGEDRGPVGRARVARPSSERRRKGRGRGERPA